MEDNTITVGTLINWLERMPQDLKIYASIPNRLTGVEIVDISKRHSMEWGVPEKFVMLNIN